MQWKTVVRGARYGADLRVAELRPGKPVVLWATWVRIPPPAPYVVSVGVCQSILGGSGEVVGVRCVL